MTRPPSTSRSAQGASESAPSADELRALFEAKVRAELEAADRAAPGSDRVPSTGALLAHVALVKGLAGPAEATGGAALSGSDGAAADLALAALGLDPSGAFRILSRPEPGVEATRRTERLRLAIEATDPGLVIALDAEAAEDLASAFGVASLRYGKPARVLGRTLLAVDGLEASLTDQPRKRRVWRQFQAVSARETG